jgi:peptidoglycan/xylan/chitin deacetylase (PgdA/CDA1 family)
MTATDPGAPPPLSLAGRLAFTSSWDDGHPLDLRLAELLQRHGFAGTFYVPTSNRAGLPVMAGPQLRQLAALAELGSHTLDHCYLPTVSAAQAEVQIRQGKSDLEQALGHSVAGFCYPGGRFSAEHRRMVAAAGFVYARTTVNFCSQAGADRFQVPTSLQLYPHAPSAYLRNWLRRGQWRARHDLARIALSNTDLLARLRAALASVGRRGGLFHLWGHSWEFDAIGGWRVLDEFLRYAGDLVPVERRWTNHAAICHAGLAR